MAPKIDVDAVFPPKVNPVDVVAVDVGAPPKIDPVAGAALPKMEPVAGAETRIDACNDACRWKEQTGREPTGREPTGIGSRGSQYRHARVTLSWEPDETERKLNVISPAVEAPKRPVEAPPAKALGVVVAPKAVPVPKPPKAGLGAPNIARPQIQPA